MACGGQMAFVRVKEAHVFFTVICFKIRCQIQDFDIELSAAFDESCAQVFLKLSRLGGRPFHQGSAGHQNKHQPGIMLPAVVADVFKQGTEESQGTIETLFKQGGGISITRRQAPFDQLKQLQAFQRAHQTSSRLRSVTHDHLSQIDCGLGTGFFDQRDRRVFEDQFVACQLKEGLGVIGLERKGKLVVEKIVAQVGDQHNDRRFEIKYAPADQQVLLVGAEPGNGKIQVEIAGAGTGIEQLHKGLFVVYAQAEGKTVSHNRVPPHILAGRGFESTPETIGVGGVADVKIMVPVATLPIRCQGPAEISVVNDKPGGKGIAFSDRMLSETQKRLTGGQHQRKAGTYQNGSENNLLGF